MFIPLETFIKTLPDCHQCQTKILSNLLEDLSEKRNSINQKSPLPHIKRDARKDFCVLNRYL